MATFLQNEESDIPVVGGVASMKEGLSINHKQRISILVVGYMSCATIRTSEKKMR